MLIIFLIAAMVGLDQLVKYITVANLDLYETIPVLDGVFHITYVQNTGAAFSLLEGQQWFFLLTTPVIIFAIVFMLYKNHINHMLGKISTYLIIAGAIGNFIDRLFLGYVVDMFDFRLINFAVFNVADIFVTVGATLLFIYIIFLDKDNSKQEKEITENNDI